LISSAKLGMQGAGKEAMAEIINFNRARMTRERQAAAQRAAENRVKHGRTPEQKAREAAALEEEQRRLDLLKRDPPPED
jgi:hypothetical protein